MNESVRTEFLLHIQNTKMQEKFNQIEKKI